MAYETIIWEKADGVGVLTLNRPKAMNTMTPQLIAEFGDAINAAANDPEVRVVVLQAAGKNFGAGGDFELLKALDTAPKAKAMIGGLGETIQKMYSMPKPIIAAVRGAAAGGSANMALSCDFVIASEKAKFGQAFINIGLIPDTGGVWSLARLVGPMRAKELALTGRLVPAQEALDYGMILKVVPDDKLEEEVMAFAKELAGKAPIAAGYIKMLTNRLSDIDIATYCDLEADYMGIALQTKDHKEGLAAFGEKRKAVFTGE